MIDGYDDVVRNVLVTAYEEARRSHHEEIRPEHILLSLINETDSSTMEFITRHGLTPAQIHARLQTSLSLGAPTSASSRPEFSFDATAALAHGRRTAATQSRRANTNDLLTALLAHSPSIAAALGRSAETGRRMATPATSSSDDHAEQRVRPSARETRPAFDYTLSIAALNTLRASLAAIADAAEAGELTNSDETTGVLSATVRELEIVQFGIRNVLHALPMAQDDWADHARLRPEFAVMDPAMQLIEELFRINAAHSVDEVLALAGHTFFGYLRIKRELYPPAQPGSSSDLATLEPLASRLPDWIRACVRARKLATVIIGIDDLTSVTSTVNPSWWQDPDEHTFRQALLQAKALHANGDKQFLGRWHFERYHRNLGRKRVALARKHSREIAFVCAQATSSVPHLAADLAQRDIVYLGASLAGDGIAMRMNGSTKETDGIVLPGFGREEVAAMKRLEANARAARAARQLSYAEYAAALWSLILGIGENVIEPLMRRWPEMRRMALIPIGHAYGLPYGVVPLATEEYRQRDLDVTVCPSARTMLISALSTRTYGVTPRVFVGADCDQGRNLIPRAADEVDQVAAIWDVEPTVFNRPQAPIPSSTENIRLYRAAPASGNRCPTDVLDAVIEADVVHLSCHGRLNEDPPSAELCIGGVLDTTQLLQRGMRAGATVVLSACSVGNINARYSTEVLGFPTTVLGSGAREVIASLWPVPDSTQTVELMVSIHRLLRSGHSPNESFRQTIIDAADAGESPAIWGGYNMFGV